MMNDLSCARRFARREAVQRRALEEVPGLWVLERELLPHALVLSARARALVRARAPSQGSGQRSVIRFFLLSCCFMQSNNTSQEMSTFQI